VSEKVSPQDCKPALQYLAGLTNKFSNEPSKKVSEAAIKWLAPKLAFFKKEVSILFR
jgi:hypothetical protein